MLNNHPPGTLSAQQQIEHERELALVEGGPLKSCINLLKAVQKWPGCNQVKVSFHTEADAASFKNQMQAFLPMFNSRLIYGVNEVYIKDTEENQVMIAVLHDGFLKRNPASAARTAAAVVPGTGVMGEAPVAPPIRRYVPHPISTALTAEAPKARTVDSKDSKISKILPTITSISKIPFEMTLANKSFTSLVQIYFINRESAKNAITSLNLENFCRVKSNEKRWCLALLSKNHDNFNQLVEAYEKQNNIRQAAHPDYYTAPAASPDIVMASPAYMAAEHHAVSAPAAVNASHAPGAPEVERKEEVILNETGELVPAVALSAPQSTPIGASVTTSYSEVVLILKQTKTGAALPRGAEWAWDPVLGEVIAPTQDVDYPIRTLEELQGKKQKSPAVQANLGVGTAAPSSAETKEAKKIAQKSPEMQANSEGAAVSAVQQENKKLPTKSRGFLGRIFSISRAEPEAIPAPKKVTCLAQEPAVSSEQASASAVIAAKYLKAVNYDRSVTTLIFDEKGFHMIANQDALLDGIELNEEKLTCAGARPKIDKLLGVLEKVSTPGEDVYDLIVAHYQTAADPKHRAAIVALLSAYKLYIMSEGTASELFDITAFVEDASVREIANGDEGFKKLHQGVINACPNKYLKAAAAHAQDLLQRALSVEDHDLANCWHRIAEKIAAEGLEAPKTAALAR